MIPFDPTPKDLTLADLLEELDRRGFNDLTSVTFCTPFGPVLATDDGYDVRRDPAGPVVFFGDPTDLGDAE